MSCGRRRMLWTITSMNGFPMPLTKIRISHLLSHQCGNRTAGLCGASSANLSQVRKFQSIVADMSRFGTLSAACTEREATTMEVFMRYPTSEPWGSPRRRSWNWLQRQRPSSTTRKCGSGAPPLTPSVWSEDEAYKSYGVLKYARKITEKDARIFISQLMAGKRTADEI